MAKGLKLDQFKEPAFSANILCIQPKKIYINSVHENLPEKKDFKSEFLPGKKFNKGDVVTYKLIEDVADKYNSIKVYSYGDYTVKDIKYLIDENEHAESFIVIEAENELSTDLDFFYNDNNFTNSLIQNQSIDDIINLAYKASIIDETDGEYLFKKFLKLNEVFLNNGKIYIDAIDDQPYTSSKEAILLHYPNAIDLAVKAIKNAFKTEKIDIIFYDVESYNREIKIPKKCGDIDIIKIKGNYPVRHNIKNKLKYNYFIGIQSMLHLARVLLNSEYKQTTTFITVAGNAVKNPKNVEVPIGTPVEEIINEFLLNCEPKRIILGQAITGISVTDVDIPVSATTRSVLLFSDYVVSKKMECIGCAKCADVCPQNLLPSYRNKFKETGDKNFKEFSSEFKCIKCYCCTYICPSHIDLVN